MSVKVSNMRERVSERRRVSSGQERDETDEILKTANGKAMDRLKLYGVCVCVCSRQYLD